MSHDTLDTHINFRISTHDKNVIETAARLKGVKFNTYARQKLLSIAEQEIIEMNKSNTIFLNESEWHQFMELMDAPIHINKNLKKAISSFNDNISE